MVTLPKRKNAQSERSASRPALAEAANGERQSNRFGAAVACGRAASRGRLALRRRCSNALAQRSSRRGGFIASKRYCTRKKFWAAWGIMFVLKAIRLVLAG